MIMMVMKVMMFMMIGMLKTIDVKISDSDDNVLVPSWKLLTS